MLAAMLTLGQPLLPSLHAQGAPPAPPAPLSPSTPADPAPEAVALEKEAPKALPVVVIETSLGTIKAELFEDKAPISVKNFLNYVDKGFYDGLIFHRVIKGFMVQGGGFSESMQQKQTDAPIKNEAQAEVPNKRGTLAMARTGVVDSATAQFFVNLVDNTFLDHKNKTPQGFGYAVFGQVTEGMDVVDKIAAVQTGTSGPFSDVPTEAVIIKSIKRAE